MRRVEVTSRRRLLDDFLKIDEALVRNEQTDGTLSEPVRHLSLERGDAAAALLRRTDTQRLVLVRQFRYPTYEKGPGWLLELVAGMISGAEEPASAMQREILEETGYQARELVSIGTYYLSPGGSSERVFLYYAEVEDADRKHAGGGMAAEHEDIEVVELEPEVAVGALAAGQIQDAKTALAIQWLQLQCPELKT